MRFVMWCLAALAFVAFGGMYAFRPDKPTDIAAQIEIMTVGIRVNDGSQWGTGVAVRTKTGWAILTAAYVAMSGDCVAVVENRDGMQERYELDAISLNIGRDLAIMAPRGHVEPPARLAEISSRPPLAGERVWHYGACYGDLSHTTGIVSSPVSVVAGNVALKLTNVASPGSSGGGVFNRHCELVGIISRARPGEFSWAAPIQDIAAILE